MFEVAAAAKKEVEGFNEPADRFMKEVGGFVEEKARAELDRLKTTTGEIAKLHQDVCDFYTIGGQDDMRTDSVEFFKMWRTFLQDANTAMPKAQQQRGAGLGRKMSSAHKNASADDAAQRAMKAKKAQIAELQAKLGIIK